MDRWPPGQVLPYIAFIAGWALLFKTIMNSEFYKFFYMASDLWHVKLFKIQICGGESLWVTAIQPPVHINGLLHFSFFAWFVFLLTPLSLVSIENFVES